MAKGLRTLLLYEPLQYIGPGGGAIKYISVCAVVQGNEKRIIFMEKHASRNEIFTVTASEHCSVIVIYSTKKTSEREREI
jgi:hypothetical protein